MANIPMKISNNAVTEGTSNGNQYVYSFGGIDSTKNYTGINLKSFRYHVSTNSWDTIPDLPDSRGKIASGASTIDSIVYIIGGYHVYFGGNEVSSNKVHRFNINTNTYLTDATPIPVPIDDHVQAVWKDSLIYAITGWSNSGNVPNVQIYNPTTNSWTIGTSTPNNNNYKSFGASGTIVGNTIYYFGGASMGGNFPCQNIVRIGEINPSNPTQITWRMQIPNASLRTYRAACITSSVGIHWLGGSETTYNYNGIAYNGTGGVSASNKNIFYNTTDSSLNLKQLSGDSIPMDLRGIANFGNTKYIAGGMLQNQKVSNKTYRLTYYFTDLKEVSKNIFEVYPNPSRDRFSIKFPTNNSKTIRVYNLLGKEILSLQSSNDLIVIETNDLKKGIYFIKITDKNNSNTYKTKKLIVNK
jgi:hypothetical protein